MCHRWVEAELQTNRLVQWERSEICLRHPLPDYFNLYFSSDSSSASSRFAFFLALILIVPFTSVNLLSNRNQTGINPFMQRDRKKGSVYKEAFEIIGKGPKSSSPGSLIKKQTSWKSTETLETSKSHLRRRWMTRVVGSGGVELKYFPASVTRSFPPFFINMLIINVPRMAPPQFVHFVTQQNVNCYFTLYYEEDKRKRVNKLNAMLTVSSEWSPCVPVGVQTWSINWNSEEDFNIESMVVECFSVFLESASRGMTSNNSAKHLFWHFVLVQFGAQYDYEILMNHQHHHHHQLRCQSANNSSSHTHTQTDGEPELTSFILLSVSFCFVTTS